ncbi:hypothetical protein WME99_22600 [Sorangium sp. So ce136]|uniref:hypothetical protein n=1 Tax=Sorangium sp. So ce136 TaxID=3133284 RepID=UPI003F0DC934
MAFGAGAGSSIASTKQIGHGCPKTSDLALEHVILPPQARLLLPQPREIGFLRLKDVVQMAPLDELRAVEVKALDVKPAARREPDQPAVHRLLDVRAEIVAMRAKKPQAVRSIGCGA